MAIPNRIKQFLEDHHAPYVALTHPERFTSSEVAQVSHISGRELAKVLMVRADDKDIMVMLPATHRLDLDKLKKMLGVKSLRLEEEREFRNLFPECDAGAMPPFEELFHLSVVMDRSLADCESVAFNGGTHKDAIKMRRDDFAKVTHPTIGEFALEEKPPMMGGAGPIYEI